VARLGLRCNVRSPDKVCLLAALKKDRLKLMSSGSPLVDRMVLINHLRTLRTASGEKQETVARALEWSLSKFVRIENGAVRISRSDLEALLRHYHVADEKHVAELIALARGAREVGWWSKYRIPDKSFEAYLGYESSASSIKTCQGLLIPGLLQTETYARFITSRLAPAADVENIVGLRLERQENVFLRAPEQCHILDEAVLLRRMPLVMKDQIHHILEISELPSVTIHIIPASAGAHFGMRGPFTLLGFDADLDDILYFESARRGDLLIPAGSRNTAASALGTGEDVAMLDEIAEHIDAFQALLDIALDPADSCSLLGRLAQEASEA
jgi:transcriptional regulator with XRE-family HTH domain